MTEKENTGKGEETTNGSAVKQAASSSDAEPDTKDLVNKFESLEETRNSIDKKGEENNGIYSEIANLFADTDKTLENELNKFITEASRKQVDGVHNNENEEESNIQKKLNNKSSDTEKAETTNPFNQLVQDRYNNAVKQTVRELKPSSNPSSQTKELYEVVTVNENGSTIGDEDEDFSIGSNYEVNYHSNDTNYSANIGDIDEKIKESFEAIFPNDDTQNYEFGTDLGGDHAWTNEYTSTEEKLPDPETFVSACFNPEVALNEESNTVKNPNLEQDEQDDYDLSVGSGTSTSTGVSQKEESEQVVLNTTTVEEANDSESENCSQEEEENDRLEERNNSIKSAESTQKVKKFKFRPPNFLKKLKKRHKNKNDDQKETKAAEEFLAPVRTDQEQNSETRSNGEDSSSQMMVEGSSNGRSETGDEMRIKGAELKIDKTTNDLEYDANHFTRPQKLPSPLEIREMRIKRLKTEHLKRMDNPKKRI